MGKITLVLSSNIEDLKNNVIKMIDLKSARENVVIVPDRFSLLSELAIFNQHKTSSVFNTNVMPISRLATSLLEKIGKKIDIVTKEEEGFLIRRSIQKTSHLFKVLPQTTSVGLCEEVASTIAQLKANKVAVENLKNTQFGQFLQDKLDDIMLIYAEYEALLGEKADSGRILEVFDQNIENIAFLQNMNLFFVGFDSFTTQIFELIKKLKKYVPQIVVGAFYHFNSNNKKVFELDVYEKFNTFKKEEGFEIIETASTLPAVFDFAHKNVLSRSKENLEINEEIKLFSYENPKQEIEFTLKEIASLIKEEGLRYSDFAIATQNLERQKNALELALKKFDLSYYLDTSYSFSKTPLGEFVLLFLNLILKQFDKNALKGFLGSIFVGLSFNERAEMFNLLDKYLTFYNDLKTLEKVVVSQDREVYQKFRKYFFKFNAYREKLFKAKTIFDFVNFINEFLEDFEVEKVCEVNALKLSAEGQLKEEKIFLQLYSKCTQSLNSLNAYLQDEEVSADEFYDLLKNSFESKKVSTVPMSGDCIFVGETTTSFFPKVKHLFVLGASYSSVPQKLEDKGILNDKNLEEMEREIKVSPKVQTINKRNKFKLLNLFAIPEKTLTISYSAVGDGEENNTPSVLMKDLEKIFKYRNENLKIVSRTSLLQNLSEIDQMISIEKHAINTGILKEFLLKNFDNKMYKKKFVNSVYNVLKQEDKFSESELNLLKREYELPKIKNARQLFFKVGNTKVSQLEAYFKSPFMHFLSYGLKLQENETSDISKLEIGNFLHFVAEEFLTRNVQTIKVLTEEEIAQQAKQIALEAKKKESFYKFFINFENKTLFKLLQEEAITLCVNLALQQKNSRFTPKHFEKAINQENYFEKANLSLRGRVDRIDEFGNGFVIYDYKSGKVELNAKLIYTGEKIQLLIYADIYARQTGKTAMGVFYFPIKNSFDQKNEKKMRGLFNLDPDNVLNLDTSLNYENNKSEFVAGLGISTDQKYIKNNQIVPHNHKLSKSFYSAISYAKKVCENALEEILQGNIAMNEKENPSLEGLFEDGLLLKLKDNTNLEIPDDIFEQGEE
ncbi:MAG: PD-(D/E)XK nuclease family protein [Christensenellales bacterium]|jgi:ATP-dependent helicase/nuclease subunit B